MGLKRFPKKSKKSNVLTFKRTSDELNFFGEMSCLTQQQSEKISWDVKISFDFDILNGSDDIIKGINRYKEINPKREFKCLKKGRFSS
jgi:hypothetical protein